MLCDACGGTGSEIMEWHGMTMSVPCYFCNGTGKSLETIGAAVDEDVDLPEEDPDEPEGIK